MQLRSAKRTRDGRFQSLDISDSVRNQPNNCSNESVDGVKRPEIFISIPYITWIRPKP